MAIWRFAGQQTIMRLCGLYREVRTSTERTAAGMTESTAESRTQSTTESMTESMASESFDGECCQCGKVESLVLIKRANNILWRYEK